MAAPAPAPPDVTAGELLVEGGPGSTTGKGDTGALAYAGLTYDLDAGTTATALTVVVAPNTVSTPSTTLQLCPITSVMRSEQGGPASEAPTFDCSTNVTASPSGGSYRFDVSSLTTGSTLAVAILPTAPSDRVVLAKPDSSSLSVTSVQAGTAPAATQPGSAGAGTTGTESAGPAGSQNGTSDSQVVATASNANGSAVAASSTAPTDASGSTPTPAVGVGSAAGTQAAAAPAATPAPATAGANAGSHSVVPTALASAAASNGGSGGINGVAAFVVVAALIGAWILWRSAAMPGSPAGAGGDGAEQRGLGLDRGEHPR